MCTEHPAPNTGATAPCCEKPEGALGAGRGRGEEASVLSRSAGVLSRGASASSTLTLQMWTLLVLYRTFDFFFLLTT